MKVKISQNEIIYTIAGVNRKSQTEDTTLLNEVLGNSEKRASGIVGSKWGGGGYSSIG